MKGSVGVIGGADGPTVVMVSGGPGQMILLLFSILMVILALTLYFGRRRSMHRYFGVLGAAWVVIIDQQVKRWVTYTMKQGETADLLPPLLRLRCVHNYGAAWSSFSGERWFLVAVTVIGMGAIVWVLVKVVRHPLGVWSLLLVMGGGIANLIDRVRLGYVVDMLEFMFVPFPVFNVADIFVTCGTVAAAVYYLSFFEKYDAKNFSGVQKGRQQEEQEERGHHESNSPEG